MIGRSLRRTAKYMTAPVFTAAKILIGATYPPEDFFIAPIIQGPTNPAAQISKDYTGSCTFACYFISSIKESNFGLMMRGVKGN